MWGLDHPLLGWLWSQMGIGGSRWNIETPSSKRGGLSAFTFAADVSVDGSPVEGDTLAALSYRAGKKRNLR